MVLGVQLDVATIMESIFLAFFQRCKHVFDDGFAADFNERFFFGEFHAGAFAASHNQRNYTHATTANKTTTQTIRVNSLVAPKTSPVTPLKCLCATATITKPVITACQNGEDACPTKKRQSNRKRNHQCHNQTQVAFASMHGFQKRRVHALMDGFACPSSHNHRQLCAQLNHD